MNDLPDKPDKNGTDRQSVDPVSERLVVVVALWIAAAALLPLHAFFAYNLFFTQPAYGLFALFLVVGLPLAMVDIVAFLWFRDNYLVFRWINRSDEAHMGRRDESKRR